MSTIDFIRSVNAAKNLKFTKFEFVEFDDLSKFDIEEHKDFPDLLEIFARIKVSFAGEPPESYKALNLLIGDWVNDNLKEMTKVIHAELKKHMSGKYPDSDVSALDNEEDTAIWTDQLDYMPDVDEKSMVIDVELVLHGEPIKDE